MVKNLSTKAGHISDADLIPGSGRFPGVFLPGESHGQQSLVGYSPYCLKESDTIEATYTHTHTQKMGQGSTSRVP